MPDRHGRPFGLFRRRRWRGRAPWRVWQQDGVLRPAGRMPLGRRSVSLVISALMVLATGVVTLALGPARASAAPEPVAAAALSSALPNVTVHVSTAAMTNITAHTGVTRTATCPTGTVMVGGGGYLRNATNPATLPTNGLVLGGTNPSTGASPVDQPVADATTNPSNWMAIANFTGRTESGDQAAGFALCASSGPAHTVVKTATTTGANATQQAQPPNLTIATCSAGTTLIGGGAFTNTPDQVNDGTTVGNNGNLKPLGSYPSNSSGVPATNGSTSATSWSAYGSAGMTNTTDAVTSIALCTSDPIPPVQVARVDISGPDAQPGTTITTATAVCPTGTQMLGGGYKTDETVTGTAGLQPQQGYHMRGSYPSTGTGTPPTEVTDGTTNPNAWTALLQAGGQNLPTGSSMQLHTFAMCFNTQVAMVTRSSTSLPNNVTIAQLQNLYNCVSPPPVGTFVPMLPAFGSGTRASFLSLLGIPDTAGIGTAGNRPCVRTTDVNGNPLQENSANLLFAPNQLEPYAISALISQESREVADVHGTAIMGETGGTVSLLANPAVTNGITYLTRGSTTVPKSLTIAQLQNLYNCVSPPPVGTFTPMLPAFGSTLRTNFLNELGIPDTADIGTAGNRPCVRTTDVNGNPLQQNAGNLLFAANQLVPYDITAFINQQSRTVPDVHGNTILDEINGTVPLLPNPVAP